MKRKTALVLLFFIILSYPFLIKYNYVAHNQFEQLPLILRSLDAQYLQNDWFVNANTQFSPRYFFTLYIGLLSRLIGIPMAYFSNFIFMVGMLAIATYYFTRKIFRNEMVSLLTTITIIYGQKFTLGGNDLIGRDFDPSRLSFSLILLGLVLLLRHKYIFSSILFSASFYIHPLIGIEGPLVFYLSLILYVITSRPDSKPLLNIKRVFRSILTYLLLSVFPIYSYAGMFFTTPLTGDLKRSVILLLSKIVLPFHYSPVSWPAIAYIRYFSFFLLFFIAYHLINKIIPYEYAKIIRILISVILILSLTGFIFTDIFPVYLIVISQLFRLTVIVYWLMAVILYGTCYYFSQNKKRAQWRVIPLFVIPLLLSQSDMIRYSSGTHLLFIFSSIFASFLFLILHKKYNYIIILLTVFIFSLIFRHYEFVYSRVYPFPTAETSIALWVKKNTPVDAVFLTPPSFFRFRLTAQRAIIVDWLAGSFRSDLMIQWFNRLKDVAGMTSKENSSVSESGIYEGYNKMDMERLTVLKEKYNFEYLVMDNKHPLPLPVVYADGDYTVYSVR